VTPYERRLQVVLIGLVLLHAAAVFVLPGLLWGASHLSVWPAFVSAPALGLALIALLLAPQISRRFSPPQDSLKDELSGF
jgi:hypothetical protein